MHFYYCHAIVIESLSRSLPSPTVWCAVLPPQQQQPTVAAADLCGLCTELIVWIARRRALTFCGHAATSAVGRSVGRANRHDYPRESGVRESVLIASADRTW